MCIALVHGEEKRGNETITQKRHRDSGAISLIHMTFLKNSNNLPKILVIFTFFILFFAFIDNRNAWPQIVPQRGRIIFIDTFESGQIRDKWHLNESSSIKLNYSPKHVHSGSRSMEVTALPGKEAGDMAMIWFMPGYDKVHVRWYCKFSDDFDQGNLMHLNKLIAGKGRWNTGAAGKRPSGFDFFRTTLDVWRDWGKNPAPGEPILYSYFPLMKIDRKTGMYWGNIFKSQRKVLIKRDRWYCMEMMLKANTAGRPDGEQAFWVNGKLIGHFKNITWRLTDDLKINKFSFGLYIHDNKKINRVWYDDVVVSTGFVGS